MENHSACDYESNRLRGELAQVQQKIEQLQTERDAWKEAALYANNHACYYSCSTAKKGHTLIAAAESAGGEWWKTA